MVLPPMHTPIFISLHKSINMMHTVIDIFLAKSLHLGPNNIIRKENCTMVWNGAQGFGVYLEKVSQAASSPVLFISFEISSLLCVVDITSQKNLQAHMACVLGHLLSFFVLCMRMRACGRGQHFLASSNKSSRILELLMASIFKRQVLVAKIFEGVP